DLVFYSLSIKAPTGLLLFKDLRLQVIVSIYQSTWGADLESLLGVCDAAVAQVSVQHALLTVQQSLRL
ncbi:MAG: hypothetical protein ACKVOY_17680, partial [Burkholderiaceae bacterium]